MKTEPSIKFRFANHSDAKQLANLHYLCSLAQPEGFSCKLGPRFLHEYYRIILKDRMTMVLCADAGKDGIVGLISASLDANEQLEALRKGRYRLLIAAIPALIRQPSLFGEVFAREKSLEVPNKGEGFIIGSGVRLAYWGWLPEYPSKGQSVTLLQTCLKILRDLGVEVVQLEIDRQNRKVEMAHRLLGAKMVKEFTMSDGRERRVMEYHLNTRDLQSPRPSQVTKSSDSCSTQKTPIQPIHQPIPQERFADFHSWGFWDSILTPGRKK